MTAANQVFLDQGLNSIPLTTETLFSFGGRFELPEPRGPSAEIP
jgi:hypothetical protein